MDWEFVENLHYCGILFIAWIVHHTQRHFDLEPHIITKNIDGNYHTILDGHHRLQKAINTHQKTIKAKVLDLKTCPEKYQFLFR